MNKYRVKVTQRCDRNCAYCINKSEEYRKKWIAVQSIYEINFDFARSIIVSGGEPTVLKHKLVAICKAIRELNKDAPMYLQTNGAYLTKELVKELDNYIDGIGLSIHNWDEFQHKFTRYIDILRVKPIRLYVSKKMYHPFHPQCPNLNLNESMLNDINKFPFTWRIWTEDEFDKDEKIFVLKEGKQV